MRYPNIAPLVGAVKERFNTMKVDLSRVVWTSVAATGCALGSIASAIWGSLDLTLALGLVAVASALLSTREVR
jgi:uncharacterized protein (DUF2342 family)